MSDNSRAPRLVGHDNEVPRLPLTSNDSTVLQDPWNDMIGELNLPISAWNLLCPCRPHTCGVGTCKKTMGKISCMYFSEMLQSLTSSYTIRELIGYMSDFD